MLATCVRICWLGLIAILVGCLNHHRRESGPQILDIGQAYVPGDTLRYPYKTDRHGNGQWFLDIPRYTLMSTIDSLPHRRNGQVMAENLTGRQVSAFVDAQPQEITGTYFRMTVERIEVEMQAGLVISKQPPKILTNVRFDEIYEQDRQAHDNFHLR